MKYKDTGFRAIYKQFTCFPIEAARGLTDDFPGADEANCILTYGYIDREAGLTLQILACGIENDGKYRFFDSKDDVHMIIRIGAVMDMEFSLFDPEESGLKERYKEKLEILSGYAAEDEVEESRKMGFLDGSRHEEYPDDVLVYLIKDGLEPEGCWTRIVGLQDYCIVGELLNEPYQDFKYHGGDRISFYVNKNEDESITLVSNMNPGKRLTRADLEDGSLLKDAIHAFNEDRTNENFVELLELLRDSVVWIPCNAVLGEADQKFFDEQVEAANGDVDALNDSLCGKTFTTQDNIRLIPDVLKNGDDYFFPAFTSEEEMGEYGEHFSKLPDHFLHTIILARNNEKNVKGIVINAFSEPFVFDREIFDIVEKMKSRLPDEEDPISNQRQ